MIKFKKKLFSKSSSAKSVGKYLAEHPTLPISAAALGLSGLNLKVNTSRQKEAKTYQDQHLNALKEQSKVIQRNTKALEEYNKFAEENKGKVVTVTQNIVPEKKKAFISF